MLFIELAFLVRTYRKFDIYDSTLIEVITVGLILDGPPYIGWCRYKG